MYCDLSRCAQTIVFTPPNHTISIYRVEVWFTAIPSHGAPNIFNANNDGVAEGFCNQLSSAIIEGPILTTLDVGRIGPVDVRTSVPVIVAEPTVPHQNDYLGWESKNDQQPLIKWDFANA
jgi:hypothetical protein